MSIVCTHSRCSDLLKGMNSFICQEYPVLARPCSMVIVGQNHKRCSSLAECCHAWVHSHMRQASSVKSVPKSIMPLETELAKAALHSINTEHKSLVSQEQGMA